MPTLPCTIADRSTISRISRISATPGPDTTALVLGSRLELRSLRDVPAFLRAAMKVRRQVLRSSGAHGVSLIAEPVGKAFWTLSAWADQGALDAFVGTSPHTEVMQRFGGRLADSSFVSWDVPASALPRPRSRAEDLWHDAKQRLATTAGAHR